MEQTVKKQNRFVKKTVQMFDATKRFVMFDDKRSSRRKLYSSLWAVFFGLLAASIIYWLYCAARGADDVNIFTFITNVFDFGNRLPFYTVTFFVFFALTGFAVSIGFKSGLFNIGIAGQMTLPAIIFFAVLIIARVPLDQLDPSYLIGMVFIFILIGGLTGALSGVLKAFFNVHEVISTIFINWIVTFIGVYLFTRANNAFNLAPDEMNKYLSELKGTQIISLTDVVAWEDLKWQFVYFGLAVVAVVTIGMWFIYSKTTLGYKIKMVGLNKSNAKYVGINEKLVTIGIMGASGAFAGLAGFYYIIILNGQFLGDSAPYAIGFESIAIALIALNNPYGVLASSVLYAYLNASQESFQIILGHPGQQIQKDFFPIITGFIVFMAALSVMFYKFKVIDFIKKYAVLFAHKEYWANYKVFHNLGTHSHKAKSWTKAKALFAAEWSEQHADVENYAKNAQYKKDLAAFSIQWSKEYEAAKKINHKEIRQLKTNTKQRLQALSKTNDLDFYIKQNEILSDYQVKYIELYKQFNNLSKRKELKMIKANNKARLAEFKILKRQYDNDVAKLIVDNKNSDTATLMKMYDEISVLKFKLGERREQLGLNQYYETVNKYKAQSRSRKIVYNGIKNKIFDDFHEKYFKKPYENLVTKYVPVLDEEGENI
ncbi:ABC transporter permease [Mycoplasma sp. HF11B]|uniref:ABC transporter permease n=1 Tax=unclassified Mycoplasma TaxID=2683645 RepID=UPI003AAC0EEF